MLQTQEMNKSRPSSMKRGDGEQTQMKDKNNLQIAPPKENPDELENDLIPDELLFALTQMSSPADEKRPTNDRGESMKEVLRKGPPASVWHHKSRRSTFRHLTDHPRSHGTGVGTRDVSYIYDLKSQQTPPQPPSVSKLDRSSTRLKADKQSSISSLILPESIIPDEYHIVKSKRVLGLEYIDEKDTTSLVDVDKTLRIFPSLKPSKRHEAVQLLNTFEYMLQKSGFNDEQAELTGPSQIHHLLELVKKEQKIYDLAFSEIIRQVSVGCVERGQLLSKLRMKYADLISRIPRQIKSLHAEVLAQRALDRRLTEELSKFKSSIAQLTGELKVMKTRDEVVTQEAEVAEVELTKALEESQSNASLVEEYHSLYELQRKRLEENIGGLLDEKELWCKSALTLSRKVMDANSLKTSKKLNVVEKSWSKLAQHFGVFLDDHDTTALSKVESSMEKWHSMMIEFNNVLDGSDRRTEEFLSQMKQEVTDVKTYIKESVLDLPASSRKSAMDADEVMETLANNFNTWEKKFKKNLERFSSDHILDKTEQLEEMKAQLSESTESATKVFRRHKTSDGELHEYSENMNEVLERITDLESQLTVRMNGENGLLQEMKKLHAGISEWSLKINASKLKMKEMHEDELEKLYENLDDFVDLSEKAKRTVRRQQAHSDKMKNIQHIPLDAQDVMQDATDWVKQSVRGVEAQNSKLLTEASSLHGRMTQWMVQSLLHLAPDKDTSKAAQPQDDSFSIFIPIEDLHEEGRQICEDLANYTSYLAESVSGIVELKKLESKNLGIEDQDAIEHQMFKQEARDWVVSAENVLKSITGSSTVELTDAETEKKLELKRSSKRRLSTPHAHFAEEKEEKKRTMPEESEVEAGDESEVEDEDEKGSKVKMIKDASDQVPLHPDLSEEESMRAEEETSRKKRIGSKEDEEGKETEEAETTVNVKKAEQSPRRRVTSRRVSKGSRKKTAEFEVQVSEHMIATTAPEESEEQVGIRWQYYRNQLDPYAPFQRPSPLRTDEKTDTNELHQKKLKLQENQSRAVGKGIYHTTGTDSTAETGLLEKSDNIAPPVTETSTSGPTKPLRKDIGYSADITDSSTTDTDSSGADKYRMKETHGIVEVMDFGIQVDISDETPAPLQAPLATDTGPTTSLLRGGVVLPRRQEASLVRDGTALPGSQEVNLIRDGSVPPSPLETNDVQGLWNVAMTEYNSRLNEEETIHINSTIEKTLWTKPCGGQKEVLLKSFRSPRRHSLGGHLEERAAKRKEELMKKKEARSRSLVENTSRISSTQTVEDRKDEKIAEEVEGEKVEGEKKVEKVEGEKKVEDPRLQFSRKFEDGPRISLVEDDYDDDDYGIDPCMTASDSRLVTRKEDCPREKAQAHTRTGTEGLNKRELEVPTIEEILSGDVSARKRFKRLNSLEKADVIGTLLKKIEIPVFKEMAGDAISGTSTTKFGEIEIETLAADENVVCHLLSDITLTKLVPPSSKLTQSAYEAIAKVDQLQHELIETEERAQSAEANVLKLQEQVVLSEKRIRELEQTVKELQLADRLKSSSDEIKDSPSTESVQEDASHDRDDEDVKSQPSQHSAKKTRGSGKKKKGSAKK